MKRNTNQVVSIYRSTQTVDSLRRINNVTGTEFPVSGDAPLRASWERLDANEQCLRVQKPSDTLFVQKKEIRDDCTCGWYTEPHGELMCEPEPDCPQHGAKSPAEGLG